MEPDNGHLDKLDRVPMPDDGCNWILREGEEPFAVLPCDRCESPVEVSEDEVICPKCGNSLGRTLGEGFYAMLERWNEAGSAGVTTRE